MRTARLMWTWVATVLRFGQSMALPTASALTPSQGRLPQLVLTLFHFSSIAILTWGNTILSGSKYPSNNPFYTKSKDDFSIWEPGTCAYGLLPNCASLLCYFWNRTCLPLSTFFIPLNPNNSPHYYFKMDSPSSLHEYKNLLSWAFK